MEKWDAMSNEQLVLEYQNTKSDRLYEYFLQKNYGLGMHFMTKWFLKYPQFEDEFHQLIRVAMWSAMSSFDVNHEPPTLFSTYFPWRLKKQVSGWRRTHPLHTVRIPAHAQEKGAEYFEENPWLISPGGVGSLDKGLGKQVEFDSPEGTLMDLMADGTVLTPEQHQEKEATHEMLRKLFRGLKPREQRCWELYLGLDQEGIPRTLQAVGDMYGITRERIRQILERSRPTLRRRAEKLGFDMSRFGPKVDKNDPEVRRERKAAKGPSRLQTIGTAQCPQCGPYTIHHHLDQQFCPTCRTPCFNAVITNKRFGPKPSRRKPESARSGQYTRVFEGGD